MKRIVLFFMCFSLNAWEPPKTHEPVIDVEIREAQQKIHEAMTKVNDIEKKLQVVEQKIYQATPGTDIKHLKAELEELRQDIKQAKDRARKAKNNLKTVQWKALNLQIPVPEI